MRLLLIICAITLALCLPTYAFTPPDLVTQTSHNGIITSIAFNSNGSLMASVAIDGSIRIWDMATCKQIHTLESGRLGIQFICFGPNNSIIVAGASSIILQWDAVSGVQLHSFGTSEVVSSVAYCSSVKILAVADNNAIHLWQIDQNGNWKVNLLAKCDDIHSLAFSDNGVLVATTGSNGERLRVWNIRSHTQLMNVNAYSRSLVALAVNPTGDVIATGGKDGIKLWDIKAQQCKLTLSGQISRIQTLSFSPDSHYLVSGAIDKKVRLWDTSHGTDLKELNGTPRSDIYISRYPRAFQWNKGIDGLEYIDDVNVLNAILTKAKNLTWDVGGTLVDLGSPIDLATISGKSDNIASATFSPNGNTIAVGRGDRIEIWDRASGILIQTFTGSSKIGTSIAFSPSNPILAVGQSDGGIQVWDLSRGMLIETLLGHHTVVRALAFSPDGRLLASGSDAGLIVLWNVETATECAALLGHQDKIRSLAFNKSGRMLASASADNTVRVWSVPYGKQLQVIKQAYPEPSDAIFSPNERFVVSGSQTKTPGVRYWSVETGYEKKSIGCRQSSALMAFTPIDFKLICANDRVIIVRDERRRKIIKTITTTSDISSILVSSDGSHLFAASVDGTVFEWDTNSWMLRHLYRGWPGRQNLIALSADGKALALIGQTPSIRLFNIQTGKPSASLIAGSKDGYAVVTPDGYYMATKDALVNVAFRINGKAFPFEQFDQIFNRPDVVTERLGFARQSDLQMLRQMCNYRMEKIGGNRLSNTDQSFSGIFNHASHESIGPSVNLINMEPSMATTDRKLTLSIQAKDLSSPLSRLKIYDNGVPLFGEDGINLLQSLTYTYNTTIPITLVRGDNKIEVFATNAQNVESLGSVYHVACVCPVDKSDLYLVAIGVSKYARKELRLGYASKDAQDIVALFNAQGHFYGHIHVCQLIDEQATRSNIIATRKFLSSAKVDDVVVVFLAGHGALDHKAEYYFGTPNFDFADPAASGLSFHDLDAILAELQPRRKLVLIDTCYSGDVVMPSNGIPKGTSLNRFQRGVDLEALERNDASLLFQDYFAELNPGSGAFVIAASRGTSTAMESSLWQNGIFTHCIREGIGQGSADHDGDGVITVTELKDYISSEARRLTNGQQITATRYDNIDYDFSVVDSKLDIPNGNSITVGGSK